MIVKFCYIDNNSDRTRCSSDDILIKLTVHSTLNESILIPFSISRLMQVVDDNKKMCVRSNPFHFVIRSRCYHRAIIYWHSPIGRVITSNMNIVSNTTIHSEDIKEKKNNSVSESFIQ